MKGASCDPSYERLGIEVHLAHPELVQAGHESCHPGGDVVIEDADQEDGQGCEKYVVRGVQIAVVQCRATEASVGHVENHWQNKQEVLVETVTNDNADPPQIPAAVHEKHELEEAELANDEVRRVCGLTALQAKKTNADVCLLDHADIVPAVTDGERKGAPRDAAAHELHQGGFLSRSEAACDHRRGRAREGEEQLPQADLLLVHDSVKHQAMKDNGVFELAGPGLRLYVTARVLVVQLQGLLQRCRVLELWVAHGVQLVALHAGVNELARDSDVDRRLHIVARQHPALDTGAEQHADGVRNARLDPILDGGDSQNLEVALHLVSNLLNHAVAIHECALRLMDPLYKVHRLRWI
mmetsp:Transcript_49587/g.138774  ORF Transcript_49587/g.138774 Transcript_49587/m.138774 type:complete len:354 (-) Transcript_49587:386-1447(-)